MESGPITSQQIDGETMETVILGTPKSLQMVTAAMKLKDDTNNAGLDKAQAGIKIAGRNINNLR